MTEKVKKDDVIKLELSTYVDGNLIETTSKELADKENATFLGELYVFLGKNELVRGLEKAIIDKEIGTFYEVDVPPEEAFGFRKPELILTFPLSEFRKNNINPYPGLVVNLNNNYGIVKSVSGGRVKVDFNSPFAGKTIHYKFKIIEIIRSPEEKIRILMKKINVNAEIKKDNDEFIIELSKNLLKSNPNIDKYIETLVNDYVGIKPKIIFKDEINSKIENEKTSKNTSENKK